MKILAFDPGKTDFAWAIINSKGKCRSRGSVRTITDLSFDKLPDELARFELDIEKLIEVNDPYLVVIERMQHRPKLGGGAVVEYINIMIGAMLVLCRAHGVKILVVPPPTWKTHIMKLFGIKKGEFTMVTQKLKVKAPPGMTRKLKGKMVPVKNTTKEFRGVLADQPGHDGLTPHEADAIGIGCYGWYKMTGIDIVDNVLTF